MQEYATGPAARTELGDAEITIVSDGTVNLPVDFIYSPVPAEERIALRTAFGQSLELHTMQANIMVIDIAGRRVMIDAGGGGKFQPSGGALPASLHAAGIAPESIDLVIYTHLHPDHLWGATDPENEALTFPDAAHVAPETEYAFWSQAGLADAMPDDFTGWIARTTQAHLARLEGRLRTVAVGEPILEGVHYVASPGHTPGHAAIVIARGDRTLVATGDVLTDPVAAFERPDWALGVDSDADQSTATRCDMLARLAHERPRVFANHLPGPGLGHVARLDGGYRWVPGEWAV